MIVKEYAASEKNTESYNNSLNVQNPDAPPPYEEIAGTSSIRFVNPGPPSSSQLSSPVSVDHRPSASQLQSPASPPVPASVLLRSPQEKTVNHLSLYSRHDPIIGTYLVDPHLKHPLSQSKRDRSLDKTHARNVRDVFGSVPGDEDDGCESDESDKKGWLRRRGTRRPEVILGIVGSDAAASQSAERKARGRVMLSSRHGRIEAKLTEIHPNRCVDLDVSTRHGNITIYLPPNYDGVIALRTRRGPSGVTFLPAFAAQARVVRGNDHEMLVSLSSTTSHTEVSTPQENEDYCIVGTRHGKITIGLHGQDEESAVARSNGLVDLVGALVGTGAKQFGSMIQGSTQAGLKILESTLQASASARANALQAQQSAREIALQAQQSARENSLQAQQSARESALQAQQSATRVRARAAETARLARARAAETARLTRASVFQARSQVLGKY
ncbi:uncharacterized protein B0H18DRAFT_994153 [Fomitopsis serialis]|uniref:uncharacterized protein n=1 Tax=Fomitopsis serialis TaxID=139415 RepID=UPI002007BA6B|nr:uncharacterized protein B0H18DRAFT_994153 [Neoantrodia serialis]KAH9930280.1 hypothetical protein B0H18DRAFT_994153 [Neoantrodia serialis]